MKRKDSTWIKILGCLAATCIILSLFMNLATIHFDIDIEPSETMDQLLYMYGLLEPEDLEEEDETSNIRMSYGLTIWEMRTLISNFTDDVVMDKEERKLMLDTVDETKYLFKSLPLETFGIVVDNNTVEELFGTFHYMYSGYSFFLILPWIILLGGVLFFVFTCLSSRVGKIISILLTLAGGGVLVFLADSFVTVAGVGAIVLGVGIVLGLVSSIASIIRGGNA